MSESLHLEMIEWLSLFCQRKHYVVYGDDARPFLERVCNEIIELDNGIIPIQRKLLHYLEKEERIARNSSVDKAQNLS
jgi:ATP-binding cassette subfamily F protein uup